MTYWYPKMFGRMLNEGLGKLHFWLTFILFNMAMFPMFSLGLRGMPRRIYDYTQYSGLENLTGINQMMSMAAFCLFGVQLIFVLNFVWSLFKGKKAGENPWEATTLEWITPSPPPHGNFKGPLQVYCGPYEYSVPGAKRDWRLQTEKE